MFFLLLRISFPVLLSVAVYLSMFSQRLGPLPSLYGTFTLLVLVSLAKRMPFSSRTGSSAMMQIDKSLEEAASMFGAGFWTKFQKNYISAYKKRVYFRIPAVVYFNNAGVVSYCFNCNPCKQSADNNAFQIYRGGVITSTVMQ